MATELETAPTADLLESGGLSEAYSAKAAEVSDVSVVANPGYGRWAVDNNVEVKPDVPVSEMGEGMQQQLNSVINPADGGIVTAVPPEHHIEVAGDALAATPSPEMDGIGGLLDMGVQEVRSALDAVEPEVAQAAPALAPQAPAPVAPAPTPMG